MSRKRGRRERWNEGHADGVEIVDPTLENSDPRPTPLEVLGLITFHAVCVVVCRWLGVLLAVVTTLLALLGWPGAGTLVLGGLGLLLLAASVLLGRWRTLTWVLERRGVKVVEREPE